MRFGLVALVTLFSLAFSAPALGTEVAGSGNKEILASACLKVAVSTTDATLTLVAGQRYRMISTMDVNIRVNATATTDGTSMLVPARTPEPFTAANTGSTAPVVHAITAAGTGTLQFCPITDGR
jgi:hypothetical protein